MLIQSLKTLLVAVLAAIGPGWSHVGDASEIVDAVARVVVEDGSRAPVYTSHAEDAVVMVYWASRESTLRVRIEGMGHAWGAWQQGPGCGRRSAYEQAKCWLWLIHEGARRCPEHPAAIVWGGCHGRDVLSGRDVAELAHERESRARELLEAALDKSQPVAKLIAPEPDVGSDASSRGRQVSTW